MQHCHTGKYVEVTHVLLLVIVLRCLPFAGEQQLLEKRLAAAGFDIDKYEHLIRTRERYKRYIATKATQPDGAATHKNL